MKKPSGFNLYLENGYVNIPKIIDTNLPFIIIIGGRGTGKTYTALKTVRERGLNCLLLRRTQAQADMISRKAMSPWKSISLHEGFDYDVVPASKGLSETVEVDENGTILKTLSYVTALSTIANLRGFDSSDIDIIIYDEFVPENHEKSMKHESDALLNMYETINRNRELSGKKPVQLVMMANANRLDSPILMGLKLTNKIESMIKKGQSYSILPERGVGIFLLQDSPISAQKANTALYRLTSGTQFEQMAIKNEFSYSDTSNVTSRSLDGCEPLFKVDDVTVYRRKADHFIYCSIHQSGTVPTFKSTSDEDLKRLQSTYIWMLWRILANEVEYESFEIKAKILSIFL